MFLLALLFLYTAVPRVLYPQSQAVQPVPGSASVSARSAAAIIAAKQRTVHSYLRYLHFPDLPIQPQIAFERPGNHPGELPPVLPAVGPSYRLGPGDEVGIFLLGDLQKEYKTVIHSDGTIYLPAVGSLRLQGQALEEAPRYLLQKLQRYYSNFSLQFSVLRARNVQVEVTGEVQMPGTYTIHGAANLFDLLRQAGGVAPLGSLRNILVRMPGRPAQRIDLYPALFDTVAFEFPALQSSTRLMVPPQQAWVAIAGAVNRPGIFQLPAGGSEPLMRALVWAGQLAATADTTYLQVSQYQADGTRKLIVCDLTGAAGRDFALRHGDVVTVFQRHILRKAAQIGVFGEVHAPGWFTFSSGLRVSDAIRLAGGLQRDAELASAEIVHASATAADTVEHIALSAMLASPRSASDPLLNPDDQVFVRAQKDWSLRRTVEIIGEVNYPGTYTIEKDSTRLSEIFWRAGGSTRRADLRAVRIRRASLAVPSNAKFERLSRVAPNQVSKSEYEDFLLQADLQALGEIAVDAGLFNGGNGAEDPVLLDGDVIEVPALGDLVYVVGRVGRPGGVPYRSGAPVAYYVRQAGDYKWDANKRQMKIVRPTGAVVPARKVHALQAGDTIWVPPKEDKTRWEKFRDTIAVFAQLATIYLVIDRALQK